MEGHTWIYVIAILAYLYYLSKVIDRNRHLYIKKSRVPEPEAKSLNREEWIHTVRQIQHETILFRKRSILYFFLIPLLELIVHLIVGNYETNGQLLSLLFLILFLACLLFILFVVNGKVKREHKKKYDRVTLKL